LFFLFAYQTGKSPTGSMALHGGQNWRSGEIVSFPAWNEALSDAKLQADEEARYRRVIISFLHFCKVHHAPASILLAKSYIEEREAQVQQHDETARSALRWFVRGGKEDMQKPGQGNTVGKVVQGQTHSQEELTGKKISQKANMEKSSENVISTIGAPKTGNSVPSEISAELRRRSDHAPLAASDLGVADWERDLIVAIRRKNFLWRTEQTYRSWATKFAEFMLPGSPYCGQSWVGTSIGRKEHHA